MSTKLNKPIQQHTTDSQLAITAYGLQAVTGNTDFALFGAVATMLATAAEDAKLEVPSPDGTGVDAALTAPIATLDDLEFEARILQCLHNCVVDATAHLLQQKGEDQKHLLLIITPASSYERSNLIDTEVWKVMLNEALSQFTDLHYHFIKADANVMHHLQTALVALHEEKFNSIIFAGGDSLLDIITYDELLQQNRLCSTKKPDGIIPGEAAACVVMQKIDVTKSAARAIIKGVSFAEEPNTGKPHLKNLTGLSTAIQNVAQLVGQTPDDIECVIRNSTSEQVIELEWYQTTQCLLPNKLPEKDRIGYQLGEMDEPPKLKACQLPEELKTSYTLGEIGAASIPLNLVLAIARFDFNYPAVKNCLICEANEFPFRGALWLENPTTESVALASTSTSKARQTA